MAARYKRFVKLCQQWPMFNERSKYVNVLGSYMQNQVHEKFAYKESTQFEDPAKCDRTLESLERLLNDHYKQKYPCLPYTFQQDNDPKNLMSDIDKLISHQKSQITSNET